MDSIYINSSRREAQSWLCMVTFAISKLLQEKVRHQSDCTIDCAIDCACDKNLMLCWFSFKWYTMDRAWPWLDVMSMSRLETSETWEHYSLLVDRNAAMQKHCQNSAVHVEVFYQTFWLMITYTVSTINWCLFKTLSPAFCCIRYCLIELNLHGGSSVLYHDHATFLRINYKLPSL